MNDRCDRSFGPTGKCLLDNAQCCGWSTSGSLFQKWIGLAASEIKAKRYSIRHGTVCNLNFVVGLIILARSEEVHVTVL